MHNIMYVGSYVYLNHMQQQGVSEASPPACNYKDGSTKTVYDQGQ